LKKEKAECITKLITQFGENLAQLIVQMSIAQNPQSQSFCRLVMVKVLSFIAEMSIAAAFF
jgi:hypothetical protein